MQHQPPSSQRGLPGWPIYNCSLSVSLQNKHVKSYPLWLGLLHWLATILRSRRTELLCAVLFLCSSSGSTGHDLNSRQVLRTYSIQNGVVSSSILMTHSAQKALGSSGLWEPSSDNELLSNANAASPIRVHPILTSWTLSVLGGRTMCASATSEPDGAQGLTHAQIDKSLLSWPSNV